MATRAVLTGALRHVRLYDFTSHGPVRYADAWQWQQAFLRDRLAALTPEVADAAQPPTRTFEDSVLVLEHPPVYTLGRSATPADLHFAAPPGALQDDGSVSGFAGSSAGSAPRAELPPPSFACDVHRVERGGKITYHGPGQLVVYPLLDLRRFKQDLHWYVEAIEEVIIRSLGQAGLPAARLAGYPGVWVGGSIDAAGASPPNAPAAAPDASLPAGLSGWERKIAQVGMSASKWCTSHGFAVNVCPDMAHFRLIVPCGIADRRVTSLQQELMQRGAAGPCDIPAFKPLVLRAFQDVFGCELVPQPAGAVPGQD